MNKIILTLIPVLLFLVSSQAAAQSQHEMNSSARNSYEKADRQLNAYWKKLMTKLKGSEKDDLRAAQREWVATKESGCTDEADKEWGTEEEGRGSAWPLTYYGCLTRKTRERLQELRKMYPAIR